MPYILPYFSFEVQRKDVFCSNKRMDLYYDQLSYESYTLPYLTSHINFYLISKLPYFLVICALLKFFHLASFAHLASWKRGGPCSVTPATSRCPGRTKHAWNQTRSFRKFNQQNTWKEIKVSSPTRKKTVICQKFGVLSSISCAFCRTMSNFGFLSICFFWFFVHPLEVPSAVFFCYFEAFRFRLDAKFGSSSVVTLTRSIGSRHTLPLICWTKSPAWTKRAKRTGRFPVASARWVEDNQFWESYWKDR